MHSTGCAFVASAFVASAFVASAFVASAFVASAFVASAFRRKHSTRPVASAFTRKRQHRLPALRRQYRTREDREHQVLRREAEVEELRQCAPDQWIDRRVAAEREQQ